MSKLVCFSPFYILMLFLTCTPICAFCQYNKLDSLQRLNLGFEQADENNLPINFRFKQENGLYLFSVDSSDRIEGNYAMKIRSLKVNNGYPLSYGMIYYYIEGDYLENKEIKVTAWLKTNLQGTSFVRFKDVFLRGIHLWRKYKSIYYTDSTTDKISFGVSLVGKGVVLIDHFTVSINGEQLNSNLLQRYGLKYGGGVKPSHLILLHHTSTRTNVKSIIIKRNDSIDQKLPEIIERETFDTYDFNPPKMIKSLNLGFEQLDENNNLTGMNWQSSGGHYEVYIDSSTRIKGKYSLRLKSTNTTNGINFVDIPYRLKGDYLKNKEVKITAYIKRNEVPFRFSSVGLWYNTYPAPFKGNSANQLFYGGMKLKGTSGWKKYKLVFYTDSSTKSISFGAILRGKGNVNVDHFEIYINGYLLNPLLIRKEMQ